MSVAAATDRLIKPHGGYLVDRTGDRPDDVDSLEVVTLTSRELSDLDMIASGALSPLEGFMAEDDYTSVVEDMRLRNGLPWALPVCLAVDKAPEGDRVALADESGKLVAVLEVEGTYAYDKDREAEQCFRTTDTEHPGVARLYDQKPLYLAGKVTVFERATPPFGELAARERDELKRVDVVRPVAGAVDEVAAVRLDQAVGGSGDAHAATCALTRPSSSSLATISCADSSASCSSVSITSSGLAGSSYGSSTPVKPLISPANALA